MSIIKSIQFYPLGDFRGQLISLESHKNIPFDIKRVYYIYNTTAGVSRGFHAHKKLEQVLVCTSGRCKILLDDGRKKQITDLDSPMKGLYVGALLWHELYDFSMVCVLMVLASDCYDEADYIREYDKFLGVVQ